MSRRVCTIDFCAPSATANRLRDGGTAVLVVSEDLDELFEISDRVCVIANGALSPMKRTGETDIEEVGRWMGGVFDEASGEGTEEAAHAD